jgi:hypothetical protein
VTTDRLQIDGLVHGVEVHLDPTGTCEMIGAAAWYEILYRHGVLPEPGVIARGGPAHAAASDPTS